MEMKQKEDAMFGDEAKEEKLRRWILGTGKVGRWSEGG